LFAAKETDTFPENALTSYATLGQLIDAFNQTAGTHVDPSLVELRDTLAHGRVIAKDFASHSFVLMKFTRPKAGATSVQTRYDLTPEWFAQQITRVGDALDQVTARYKELNP